jgi:hypothetical protein
MKPGLMQDRGGATADSHDPTRGNVLMRGRLASGVAFAGNAVARAGRKESAALDLVTGAEYEVTGGDSAKDI